MGSLTDVEDTAPVDIAEGTAVAMRSLGHTYREASLASGVEVGRIRLLIAMLIAEECRRGATIQEVCKRYRVGTDFATKATAGMTRLNNPQKALKEHMDKVEAKRQKEAYLRRVAKLRDWGISRYDVMGILEDQKDGMKVPSLCKEYRMSLTQVKDSLFVARNASKHPEEWPTKLDESA